MLRALQTMLRASQTMLGREVVGTWYQIL